MFQRMISKRKDTRENMGSTDRLLEDRHGDKEGFHSEPMSPIEEEEFYSLEDMEPLTGLKSESPIISIARQATPPPSRKVQNEDTEYSFRKWIGSIGKSRKYRFAGTTRSPRGWPGNDVPICSNRLRRRESDRTESGSIESSYNLRNVRTASISMASLGTMNRPRSNTQNSNQRSAYNSGGVSGSDVKASTEDIRRHSSLAIDEGAWNRAIHRRGVIKEMIDTETAYVASLKALSDTLSTIVVVRSGLYRSTEDLVCLHDGLLLSLEDINSSPSTSNPFNNIIRAWSVKRKRDRANSLEPRAESPDRRAMAARKLSEPIEVRIRESRSIAAEPTEAAEVAEILEKKLPQFTAYADYSLKYHLAVGEIEEFRKKLTNPDSIDLGIEALIKTVATPSDRLMFGNQGLTISDLIMKPIQRVCKYQLFLADLLRCTPVTDCPSSHERINRVLQRVIEMVQHINRCSGDAAAQDRLRKTMRLQDKLKFCRERIGERDILQDFGYVKTCGVLHFSYQTQEPERVIGEYMMCALFNTHLLLATLPEEKGKFRVVAMIRTAEIELSSANDKSGLNCEDVHFSWKIKFCCGKNVFELVATACSELEAEQWKEQLLKQVTDEEEQLGHGLIPFLQRSRMLLPLKPKFSVANDSRRPQMGRSTSASVLSNTISEATPINLIVRGTEAIAPRTSSISKVGSVGRSQTVHTHRPMAILTPKRHDRIRMEHRLSSVWTRDIIPYPGMQTGRGEYTIRTSAESLLRKFSIVRPSFMTRSSTNSVRTVAGKRVGSIPQDNQNFDEKGRSDLAQASTDSGSLPSKRNPNSYPSPGEHGLLKEKKSTLRKRLSMSLFKAWPANSTPPPPVPPVPAQ